MISRRVAGILAGASVAGALAVMRFHPFGAGGLNDLVQGLVVGLGIGVSLVTLTRELRSRSG